MRYSTQKKLDILGGVWYPCWGNAWIVSQMSPARAILIHSPGRKPWVVIVNTFIEPQRGGTPIDKVKCSHCSAAPTELLFFVPIYPGFHFGLCPHSTLGFEEVSCLRHSAPPPTSQSHTITYIKNSTKSPLKFNNTPILAMSPVRAILIHSPGRKPWVIIVNTSIEPQRGGTPIDKVKFSRCSAAPTELLIFVFSVYPGFHFGLCSHSTLGYAGVSPLQGSAKTRIKSITFLLWCTYHYSQYPESSSLKLSLPLDKHKIELEIWEL